MFLGVVFLSLPTQYVVSPYSQNIAQGLWPLKSFLNSSVCILHPIIVRGLLDAIEPRSCDSDIDICLEWSAAASERKSEQGHLQVISMGTRTWAVERNKIAYRGVSVACWTLTPSLFAPILVKNPNIWMQSSRQRTRIVLIKPVTRVVKASSDKQTDRISPSKLCGKDPGPRDQSPSIETFSKLTHWRNSTTVHFNSILTTHFQEE